MHINIRIRLLTLIVIPAGILLGGCSGKTEDVRVKTCKQLATTLLDTGGKVNWQEPKQEIRGSAFARITVKGSGVEKIQAVCLYEYDAAEETYETHIHPLSAYATVPYEMSLNGRTVAAPDLYKAMNSLRLKAGKRLIDQAKGWAKSVQSEAGKVRE